MGKNHNFLDRKITRTTNSTVIANLLQKKITTRCR